MLLVIPDLFKVQFYRSDNLKEWSPLGEFGGIGDTTRIWECPDMYELPVTNEPGKKKWVLSLSGGHPAGPAFVGMQYFIGEFNGSTFVADDPKQPPLYVDYGKDFYAGIVFNNIPKEDGRTIMIGWANNWTYGNQIPTSPWRSAMSIPRELSLKKTGSGIRLIQQPVKEIALLRGEEITDHEFSQPFESEIEIDVTTADESGIQIFKDDHEEIKISFNSTSHEVCIDRTASGEINFNKDFASIECVKAVPVNGKIKLQVFVDKSIIEIFVNDGEQVLCEQFFPLKELQTLNMYYINSKNLQGVTFKTREMKSVWR